ncbi:3-dehydroquinate synthase [Flaviflexus massiliensis]|uniref:3-dehydroquinate synthase n=1 Tax=Flaviflexus massiliensis TaxID=1522309 RepID=UPI0006D57C25|nr:3-dehydroquinate synthase [Flaviflexus massiliensis]
MSRPYAVFIGLPGSGKSTMAKHIAEIHGLESADSDDLIVEKAGKTIPEIFDEVGEEGFRKIELETIIEALSTFDGVLALGGGAIVSPGVRKALRGQRVVLIAADHGILLERVSRHPSRRPLLEASPEESLRRLSAEREPLYRQVATLTVKTDTRPPARLASEIYAQLESDATTIDVVDYAVHVGHHLDHRVAQAATSASSALVVHPEALTEKADRIHRELEARGIPSRSFVVPAGEEQKHHRELVRAWDTLGDMKMARDGVVIGLGGGATTDLAGFIAATWLRGVDLIQVPTSLLGMVDAAVGGKTGIDTPAGKNLVGAFHKPISVIADLDSLRTLPNEELVAGLGEVVKCGWIEDRAILDLDSHELLNPDSSALREAIVRSIAVKARIVTEDFKETGAREFLNYGHTLAHAIEKVENFSVRHGEAVAIGSVFAAALARAAGVSDLVEQHIESFASVGLPVTYKPGRRAELVDAMMNDKKVRNGKLRFILLRQQGEPFVFEPSQAHLDAAWEAVGA